MAEMGKQGPLTGNREGNKHKRREGGKIIVRMFENLLGIMLLLST